MITKFALSQIDADRTRSYLAARIDTYIDTRCLRPASLATLSMSMLDTLSAVHVDVPWAWEAIDRLGGLLDRGGDDVLAAIDPAVILEIHVRAPIARRPRALARLVDRIAMEFESLARGPDPSGRLAYIGSLLRSVGMQPAAQPPGAQAVLIEPQRLLLAEATELSAFANRACGHEGPLPGDLRQAMELVALSELRKYRIDVGCKLLRAAIRHGGLGRYGRECLHFLALQRRYDGSYGHLNLLNEEGAAVVDADAEVHLPTTANILAVLAA